MLSRKEDIMCDLRESPGQSSGFSFVRFHGVERMTYEGREYRFNEHTYKWIYDSIAAEHGLAVTLNGLAESVILSHDPGFEDLWEFGYIFRQMGDHWRSIKFYEWAIAGDPYRKEIRWMLPGLSSAYRKVNMPEKAVMLKERFPMHLSGHAVLFTSQAAAYSDMGDLKNAKRCAARAYAIYKERGAVIPEELHAVYRRIKA